MRFGARMKVILLFWLIPWLALLCSSLACDVRGGRGLSVSRRAAAEWFPATVEMAALVSGCRGIILRLKHSPYS